ncbi:MAG: flagellar biosynthesis protein FliQ [Candidatus Brocadiae bacterium]|nr:flagellar biosynthesis protein FliQ [Candidatus Brocadiia bacterium]
MGPDTYQQAIDLGRGMIVVALVVSLPLLGVGLAVGLLISVFQAATQVQEQTISFVPKIVATALALFILLPWMISRLTEYTIGLFRAMPGMFP